MSEGYIPINLTKEERERIKVVNIVFARLGELYMLKQVDCTETDFLEGMIEKMLQGQITLYEATCNLSEYLEV